jgi:hypothetical protein
MALSLGWDWEARRNKIANTRVSERFLRVGERPLRFDLQ